MNPAARFVIALLLILGATLFVTALTAPAAPTTIDGGESNAISAIEETGTATQAGVSRYAEAKPGVLDSSQSCRGCHEEIYEEWRSDRHSQAWVGELFTYLSKKHSDPNCFSCHAPRPILETGLASPAEARGNRRERGITCLSCHKRGNHVVGPIKDPEPADCGPMFHAEMAREGAQEATIQFCGVCHNLHGTHKEFMGSVYYREGKTCLSCHMEQTRGPVAKGGKPRVRRVHRFLGAHSLDMLRKAMTFEARQEQGKLYVRVLNQGAGHDIPTDARHRGIWLYVSFLDSYGQPVPVPQANGSPTTTLALDLIRLFYRHEQKPTTQVAPKGTVGADNWRESSMEIPAEAKGGKVRIALYYMLRWDWPREKGMLVEERLVDLD